MGSTPDKYIVEARSDAGFPSLFSVTSRGMFEVEKDKATRYDEDIAREIAKREKALRGNSRRILLIKVKA
jgi:hypothetical protein